MGLFRQCYREQVIGSMLSVDYLLETVNDVGMLRCHVVILVDVVGNILKAAFASFHHEFPVALPYTEHVRLMKLPIERVVLFLQTGLAGERGIK